MPASAQETPSGVLEEVVVTARKRQESILNVPVITTAIGGEQIERLQVSNVRAIASQVPGLMMGEQVLATGVQISLRGVGTSTTDPGVDQSVSLNIDGLQLSQGLAFQSGMFDLGQIEVYKGPQALFYGKSSPGGVIALRTADPTNKFEMTARAGYEFEAKEHQEDFIVSGPVTETLKARLAIRHSDSEGFYKNAGVSLPNAGGMTSDDARIGGTFRWMVRGTVLWTPTETFDARLKLNYARDRIKWAGAGQFTSCPEGIRTLNPGKPYMNPADSCTLDRTLYAIGMDPAAWPGIAFGGRPGLDQFQRYGTLELNYHPTKDLTLTSTTGYYSVRSQVLLSSSGANYYPSPIASQNDFHRRDFTQELRANSDFTGPLNFTAGGFYQDADVNIQITQRSNLLSGLGLPAIRSAGTHHLAIKSKSAFGQLRYEVVPRVELSAGARYTDEKRSDVATNVLTGGTLVPLPTPAIRSKTWSPEFTATYRPTDTMTVFASYKKGYKSGSFNIAVPATVNGTDISYGDEKVKGFEGGVKTRLLDRRLALNLAAYDYKYSDLQVGAVVPPSLGQVNLISKTVNAGTAKVYGVDFDVAYLAPIEGLTLRGAVNWNHAKYTTFTNAPCWSGQTVALGCNRNPSTTGLNQSQDLSGLPLIRAPRWEGNVGFTYERPVGHDMSLIVESNNQLSSKYQLYLAKRSDVVQKSFFKADLSVTLKGPQDRWEVSLAGRNLNNKLTAGNCTIANYEGGVLGIPPGNAITGGVTGGPAGLGEVSCYGDRGREVWVTVTYRPFS